MTRIIHNLLLLVKHFMHQMNLIIKIEKKGILTYMYATIIQGCQWLAGRGLGLLAIEYMCLFKRNRIQMKKIINISVKFQFRLMKQIQ
jgi:hypothetical protein